MVALSVSLSLSLSPSLSICFERGVAPCKYFSAPLQQRLIFDDTAVAICHASQSVVSCRRLTGWQICQTYPVDLLLRLLVHLCQLHHPCSLVTLDGFLQSFILQQFCAQCTFLRLQGTTAPIPFPDHVSSNTPYTQPLCIGFEQQQGRTVLHFLFPAR